MKYKTIKTRNFGIKAANQEKKDLLYDRAVEILKLKNTLSLWVCSNFLKFSTMSKFDFIKNFKNDNPLISGVEFQHAVADVFVAYENKIDKFKNGTSVRIQDDIVYTYYKRRTKDHLPGDVMTKTLKLKSTKLTKVVSFLVHYWNEGTTEYIKSQLETLDQTDKRIPFYLDIQTYLEKFGSRLTDLALSIRENVLNRLTAHPIQFTSLSFSSHDRQSTPILNYAENRNAPFNAFISLMGFMEPRGTKLHLPTNYSRKFHGDIELFNKSRSTNYHVIFEGNKPVKITLTIDGEEEIHEDKHESLGIDVNVKHNLFATSVDETIDYDRKIFDNYIKFLKNLDKKRTKIKKVEGKPQPLSNRDTRLYKQQQVKITSMLKRKCRELVDLAKAEGKDHLVLEDLKLFGKTFCRSEEFEGFKYSRLVRLLNLSNLKNILQSICNKNGLQLTTVQPHYTSQTCPECGYVSRENRQTQENFECMNCGSTRNADFNSSINIRNRFSVDVLRSKLLSKDKNGQYSPRRMKKETIKQSIEEAYLSVIMTEQKASL